MRNRALQIFLGDAVLGAIGRRKLREIAGCGPVRVPQRIERPLLALRQAAIPRVLQFLDAERQRDIASAGRDRINRPAKCFRTAGAEILDMRHGHIWETQRHRERRTALAHMLLVHGGGKPGGLDLARLDAGILHRFEIGFNHQLFRAHVPALAEFRAAHAEDCDLVFDARRHANLPISIVAI